MLRLKLDPYPSLQRNRIRIQILAFTKFAEKNTCLKSNFLLDKKEHWCFSYFLRNSIPSSVSRFDNDVRLTLWNFNKVRRTTKITTSVGLVLKERKSYISNPPFIISFDSKHLYLVSPVLSNLLLVRVLGLPTQGAPVQIRLESAKVSWRIQTLTVIVIVWIVHSWRQTTTRPWFRSLSLGRCILMWSKWLFDV